MFTFSFYKSRKWHVPYRIVVKDSTDASTRSVIYMQHLRWIILSEWELVLLYSFSAMASFISRVHFYLSFSTIHFITRIFLYVALQPSKLR